MNDHDELLSQNGPAEIEDWRLKYWEHWTDDGNPLSPSQSEQPSDLGQAVNPEFVMLILVTRS